MAVVLVEEALDFEFKAGLFYIMDATGVRVMLPKTFFATVANAGAAGRKFKFDGAEVIQFPKDAAG